MRNLLLLLLALITYTVSAQITLSTDPDARIDKYNIDTTINEFKTAACGTPWVSGGYPAWTNYWGGYQLNIVNLSTSDVTIHSFEARFQGTSGYRIYTKVGTFVGFETNPAAWTLVGSIAGGLTGISTTAPTPIPIPVEICIPAGATQAFYLTRTDNTVANRHLYVPGSGVGGVTIYASDAYLGLTEAYYVTPFFAALYAQVRRPSLDVCYSVGCSTLPVELVNFDVVNDVTNIVTWSTVTENNNDYFLLERSADGVNWENVSMIDGAGTSTNRTDYLFNDRDYPQTLNYYRLTQVDYDGNSETFDIISIDNTPTPRKLLKVVNSMGQNVDTSYKGIVIYHYSDGTTMLKYN